MSLSLYWQRPPVETERMGGVGLPTKGIVARVLFDHDGSLHGDATLLRDSPEYHYLRGVRDTATDDVVREELSSLLAVVDEYRAAQVFTDG